MPLRAIIRANPDIALSILDNMIKTRWKLLPQEQRLGIRNFLVALAVGLSNDDATFKSQRALIKKYDLTIVQILKQDWPQEWPNFIDEIVESSQMSANICENNMLILRYLSEEVFDFSQESMTQAKTNALKSQMVSEFSKIFELCLKVLEKADRPSLIQATLHSLLRYLGWIPLDFIFKTPVLELLVNKFLEPEEFRDLTLKCLTEISSLSTKDYDQQYFAMITGALGIINRVIPLQTDFKAVYAEASTSDQEYIQNLGIFLTSFLTHHLDLVERQESQDLLINAHMYLIKISKIEERELFKVCLDYWGRLVSQLYEEIQSLPMNDLNAVFAQNPFGQNLNAQGAIAPEVLQNYNLRKHMYGPVLSQLRLVMIENMARPEEVLIVENDEGEIVREFFRESDTIILYKSMREVLVYLTHLDVTDTERIMSDKLARQLDGSEWSWNNLNTLCWAIGSISGAMNEELEKRFLVSVVKKLLSLTDQMRGKDNKAVVASDIMYIVGQYPRFLKAHWKFLKTVVKKLFEFMKETHEGVQDMACDTFIKIAQKCKRHFVAQQPNETEPFIDEIVRDLGEITSALQPSQVHTFYEACGHIISAQNARAIRERLLSELMRLPNQAWEQLMNQARNDPDILSNPEPVKTFSNVMKTNVATCTALGAGFQPQLKLIYMDMLHLYRAVSSTISEAVASQGQIATRTPKVRGLRTIKKESLKLIQTYVSTADNLEDVSQNLAPPLFQAVLEDYSSNVPDARDAEVLNCMNTVVTRVGGQIPDGVVMILQNVFECTLNMINTNFTDYPEHRVGFFELLRAINLYSFAAIVTLPDEGFSLVVDACLWASKHDHREVESAGLALTYELLQNVSEKATPEFAAKFYQNYFFNILQGMFHVLTDSDHKAGFKQQCQVLAKQIDLVESNAISVPLYQAGQVPDGTSNSAYLRQYMGHMLLEAFPHLTEGQVSNFIDGLFALHKDFPRFKLNLRDFLVQIKEYGGGNTEHLYAEDKERERVEAERQNKEKALKIGGLVKPADMDEDL